MHSWAASINELLTFGQRLEKQVCTFLLSTTCLVVALFLIVSNSFARDLPASVTTSARIPFHLASGFAIILPVYIDGTGPYSFLLDTGTTITAIDRSFAVKMNLEPHGNGVVTSLVQKIPVEIAVAKKIRFGPIEETEVEVLVKDLNGLRAADPSISGVLGQNFLEKLMI